MSRQTIAHLPVVAVPAKNEEERLPLLLAALAGQSWCLRTEQPLRVVAVLNNCTDRTRDAALVFARTAPNLLIELIDVALPPDTAHVGTARQMAMDRALELCSGHNGVILSTDADAVPDPNWVEATLKAIDGGADAVGGLLYGNKQEESRLGEGFQARAAAVAEYGALCDQLASLIDPLAHDPWPRHRDHTGASLAVRAAIYQAVGGLPPLRMREDLALVSKIRAADGKLVHPLDVRVEVSARLTGRAQGGMADCLKSWLRAEAEGEPILVEDPDQLKQRLMHRRAVRDLASLPQQERFAAARTLGIPESAVDETRQRLSAGALVEQFAPDDPDAPASIEAGIATDRLRRMISELEEPVYAVG
ncbi:glycosyltransferase [Tianweitania sp. BSSL-BM11]|uniref:Glycosyltransferase n=1 Tax=Tianweitania aestuarii TaxID=2814886 RepID=A0ABS5S0N0_9HYPH|nr:glycosyltransferase [Tianweitania aestuarii]MBS9722024.1 glycosyltransferase [Tianweitania aestuarii]